MKKKQRKRGRN